MVDRFEKAVPPCIPIKFRKALPGSGQQAHPPLKASIAATPGPQGEEHSEMAIDIASLLAARQSEKYVLHDKYLNSQLVRVLRTIGYDVNFSSASGAYLYDREGRRYLDLLSGFGVFAIGRNHPTVIAALKQVLDAGMANLVQMDVSPLAGLLAQRLARRLPGMERVFFGNSGAEDVGGATKVPRAGSGR